MNFINLKIAFRNIIKNKTESIISILGLGMGFGCILLLSVLIIHEYSFDHYIPNHQSAYRIIKNDEALESYMLAPTLKDKFPEIHNFFRFCQTDNLLIKNNQNQVLSEQYFAFADPSVFECLDITFKSGGPAKTVSEVALSDKMAKKYFGNTNIRGSSLKVKLNYNFLDLTVSGVYNDFPSNSTLLPEFIADIDLSGELFGQSLKMFGEFGTNQNQYKDWGKKSYYSYLFLSSASDPKKLETKIADEMKSKDSELEEESRYRLQPVSDIYFKSENITGNRYGRAGNPNELKYYMAIAFVILCIAVINFVLLTRAKIMSRLIEMGAKKALGASGNNIRKQVLLESNLISVISVIPAFLIIIAGIPFINSTLNKTVGFEVFGMWQAWILLVLIILIMGSFSGVLIGNSVSRTPAVHLLFKQTSTKQRRYHWNNSFLSFHFAIFILLTVSIFTFKKQINYSLTNFKAINPDNILICELSTPELQQQFEMMCNELAKNPGVLKVAGSSFVPPFINFLPINLKTTDETVRFDGLIMGEGMVELLGMQVIDGESFGSFQQGQVNLIINESAALKYNLKAGEKLNGFNVRGIVKDFSAHSMHSLIQPMVILQQNPEKMRLLVIKTNGRNDASIISHIHQLFRRISPDAFVDVTFLTDQINQFYSREKNQAKLIGAFSLLAVILSIMGLFGIVLITIHKRTKEIGIRKVNGAQIHEVMQMLNFDFIKWVFVACIIAPPIAWYAMHKWLENFAYKTTLSWWVFALAGLLALVIALLTVSFQSWKAATRNPVEALRYE